jgi:hypothetical protein
MQDGESLVDFAADPAHRSNRSLVLESDFAEVGGTTQVIIPPYHQGVHVYYDAIRTKRFKYVHWFRDVDGNPADEYELYDLAADPFEMDSLHESPLHADLMAKLAEDLRTFKDCAGSDCRRRFKSPPLPCLDSPLRLDDGGFGALRVGAPSAEILREAGSPKRVRDRVWRYCVAGRGGGAAKVVFARSTEARLVATTARTAGAGGIGRGSTLAELERTHPGAERIGRGLVLGVWDDTDIVHVVRRGRVRALALADEKLLANPRALRRHLKRAGL